jgi:hypothetical protein
MKDSAEEIIEMVISPSELHQIYLSQKEDLIVQLCYLKEQIAEIDQKLKFLDDTGVTSLGLEKGYVAKG